MSLGKRPILLLQLREQPHILDGDHRLIGKGLKQLHVILRKRGDIRPVHGDGPDRIPSWSIGTDMMLRKPTAAAVLASLYSGSWSTSRMYTASRVKIARAVAPTRLGGMGYALRTASAPAGSVSRRAATGISSRSSRDTPVPGAAHRLSAFAVMASNTGCTFVGEEEMTLRMSAVAVCCSNASFVSLNNRTFSIAMTA